MTKKYILLTAIVFVGVSIGVIILLSTKSEAPSPNPGTEKTNEINTIENLLVTYELSEADKMMYSIEVVGESKSEGAQTDLVRVSGKACNNMSGGFEIIAADEAKTDTVLLTLDDGRQVLDAQIASTMMACTDQSDPQYDDARLAEIISNIGKSLKSY